MERLNILHKFFAFAVVGLFAVNQAMLIQIQRDINQTLPELRIKTEVVKQRTGENARVLVRLQNDETVEGYISRVAADSFTGTNSETRNETKLDFNTVAAVIKIEPSDEAEFAAAVIETAEAVELLLKAIF